MSGRIDWDEVATVFAGYPRVIAAWAFGSASGGILRPGSDLDLAALWDEKPSLDEMAELRADLQQALKVDEVDLVVLNSASVITRFEAVSGRPVFCRDLARRAEFVSLTAREYEDTMAFLEAGVRDWGAGGRR